MPITNFTSNIAPNIEAERLQALQQYNILDTCAEPEFDAITQLAAYICGTSMALITLIDQDRQWIKSCIGIDATETTREVSFCQYTILSDDLLEVNDTHLDHLFHHNSPVLGNPYIRFYAGAPLITPERSEERRVGKEC